MDLRKHVRWGAHWRHLANTTVPFMCKLLGPLVSEPLYRKHRPSVGSLAVNQEVTRPVDDVWLVGVKTFEFR